VIQRSKCAEVRNPIELRMWIKGARLIEICFNSSCGVILTFELLGCISHEHY